MVLPAPFGPEEGEDLALADLEVDVADRHEIPVGLAKPLDADHGFGHEVRIMKVGAAGPGPGPGGLNRPC